MASINLLLNTVPKLNGNNYHDWKLVIQLVLRRAGCWDVVLGQITKPLGTRGAGDDWDNKLEEGLMTIRLTIQLNQYSFI